MIGLDGLSFLNHVEHCARRAYDELRWSVGIRRRGILDRITSRKLGVFGHLDNNIHDLSSKFTGRGEADGLERTTCERRGDGVAVGV